MTLLLPTSSKDNWGIFPFGLLLLTVSYILIFLTFQLDDSKNRNTVIQYYFQNDIDKVEFPLYVKFIRRHMRDDIYFHNLENIINGKYTKGDIYWLQRNDPFFQACLNSDECMSPNTLTYLNWQEKRREYLRLLDKISFQKYGFKPASPSFLNIITNLFVNPDIYQFFVNLLFLVAIGVLIEVKIGLAGLFLCYCICGMSMVSIFCLISPYSLVPVSGASGGIAGLIGMLLVFSRLKKVKFYYFNFREICSFEASTGYVFLSWFFCQMLLLQFATFDGIDLISQAVAFLVGVLLAMFIQNTVVVKKHKVKLPESPTDLQSRLTEAVNEISLLNYNAAKKILYPLLEEYPTNKEIYFQLFNIIKSNPSSEEYHEIVQKIFSIKDSSRATVTMINLVFKNYVRRAQPTIRFDVEVFIGLLQRFRKAGYYEDAEKILKVLIKHNNSEMLEEVLAREQLLLARCYLMKNDKVHGDRLLGWLVETYPQTESAKQAKSFVGVKNSSNYNM